MLDYIIEDINSVEYLELAKLCVINFLEYPYFKNYTQASVDGLAKLESLFYNAIRDCAHCGFAKKIIYKQNNIGVALGFNFGKVYREYPKKYSLFFTSDDPHTNADAKLLKDYFEINFLDNFDYIMTVVIDSDYRNMGFATRLLQYLLDNTSKNLFLDTTNIYMQHIAENLGFRVTNMLNETAILVYYR